MNTGQSALSNPAPSLVANPQLKDKEAEEIILNYFKKKGFKQAEAVFRMEIGRPQVKSLEDFQLHMENDQEVEGTSNLLLFYNKNENAASFKEAYSAFCDWVHSALDIYQQELVSLLYPVFVHCYLDLIQRGFVDEAKSFMEHFKKEHWDQHMDELVKLQAISTADQMQAIFTFFSQLNIQKESEVSKLWRFSGNRYSVRLCRFSFELMLAFLHEKKYMLILNIMNQYLSIKVFNGQPSQKVTDVQTFTGRSEHEVHTINKRDIYWGLFDEQIPKPKEKPTDESGGPMKKLKKEEIPVKPPPRSAFQIPKLTEQMENEYFEDLRKRVSLSAVSLPSICFYTFFHSHNSLNSVEISSDTGLVAGAFSDSSIRVWDLKKDRNKSHGLRKGEYTRLIGHSGPVYGASFSPDSQYLLTSSEDHTVRLWNLETKSNIVCYKGHNYPVWDVDFSPHGYHFATASHDRSARLWSTDKIVPLRIFAGHLSDVNCVKFHPNCNYIATGSTDKSIRLWEINTGEPVRILTGHTGSVNCIAMSPDGKLMASAADDNKVMLWDLGTSKRIATFSGHTSAIWSLDFSAESSLLASGTRSRVNLQKKGSADQTVKVWDVAGAQGNKRKIISGSIDENMNQENEGSPELVKTFYTKQTPVFKVKFTKRNLLLAGGPFAKSEEESVV